MGGINHYMLQISAPSVMTRHRAAHYLSIHLRHKAQARIAAEIPLGPFARISITHADAGSAAPEGENLIVTLDCKIVNSHLCLTFELSGRRRHGALDSKREIGRMPSA